MPGTIVEQTLRSFERHGDAVALTLDPGPGWTYRDLHERTFREARRLTSLGVRRGDVVAVLTGDTPLTFVFRWAANVLGAAVTVLADGYAAPLLGTLLDTTGARIVVADSARYPLAADAAARSAGTAAVDIGATDPPADASPLPVRARPEDLASVPLTGGSTGVPKGVPRFADAGTAFTSEALAGMADTVQLLCTPVAHLGGTVALRVFAGGGRVVLQQGFDPAAVVAAITRERVSLLFLLPRLLYRLLDHPGLAGADTSALRSVAVGGAPVSARRLGEAVERFGPVVTQGYGSIEATNVAGLSPADMARPELRTTVGRPVPGVEIAIRDDGDGDLPVGATGRVWVRTAAMMPGYLNDPVATAAVLRDGWLDTGDLGSLDRDGYLTLAGRTKEVVFAEHARLYPAEIEATLLEHPAVASAAVFAVWDPDGVESAAAAVVARPGRDPDPAELLGWVRDRLGEHRAPSSVDLVPEFPALPSGKVDKDALRRRTSPG